MMMMMMMMVIMSQKPIVFTLLLLLDYHYTSVGMLFTYHSFSTLCGTVNAFACLSSVFH